MKRFAALLFLLAFTSYAPAQFFTPAIGVVSTSGLVKSLTFKTSNQAPSCTTGVCTYATLSFGTAQSDRYMFACFGAALSGGATVSGVTIGGVSATLIESGNGGGGTPPEVWLYAANVTSGTTGDVVITYGGNPSGQSLALYRATGLSSTTPNDHNHTNAVSGSFSLSTLASGFAIACQENNSTPAGSWGTGLTQDYTATGFASYVDSSASNTSTSSGTITAKYTDGGGTSLATMIAASY